MEDFDDLRDLLPNLFCKIVGQDTRWEYENGTVNWNHHGHFPTSLSDEENIIRTRYREIRGSTKKLRSHWAKLSAADLEDEAFRLSRSIMLDVAVLSGRGIGGAVDLRSLLPAEDICDRL
jgi:hypothetical protein